MKKLIATMVMLVSIQLANAQYSCPACTQTVNTNNATINATAGVDVICITASVTNTSFNNLNTGDIICVSPGVTWTMPTNLNFNGLVTFRIGEGANVTFPGSGSNGNLQIDNWGNLTFTNTSGVSFVANGGSTMLVNNYVGGMIDGTMVANVTFGNGADFFNQGTMNFNNLELAEAASPFNDASGIINIKRTIYIHSFGFEDYGFINTTCEDTGNPAWNTFWIAQAINGCGLTVGDKGPFSVLIGPNTCTVVTGATLINGPIMINGYYEVSGDFTVNKIVSGTGDIVVTNGVSRTLNDGALTGGVNFYDVNTALGFGNNVGDGAIFPHGLDFNNGNPQDNFVIPASQPVNPCLSGGTCSIATSGLSALMCNNATTTMSAADDYLTFSLNSTGTDLAATYNVSVSAGTITPTSASYGAATSFQLQAGSAGGGDVVVTITDADDPTCQLIVNIVDPGSCSAVMPGNFDLALTKAISSAPTPTTIGSNLTYTLTIINQGDVDATNVAISDFIPTGLTLNDANWTAVGNTATLNTPIASVPAMTQSTVDISFTVNNQASGTITNTAEISSALGGTDLDSNPGNGTAGSSEDDFSAAAFDICIVPELIVLNDTICRGTSVDLSSLVVSHTGDDLEYYTSLSDAQSGTNQLPTSSVTPTNATNYFIKSVFNPAQLGCETVMKVTVFLKSANCVGISVNGPGN